MDKLKLILGLFSLGAFSAWAAWTEMRMRKMTAQNQELALALQELKNKNANAALSDDDARAKLASNLSG